MKKGLLGLAVLFVFGLVFIGCPTDTTPDGATGNDTKLVGTSITIGETTYTFTADKVKVDDKEYDYTADGTTLKIPGLEINYTYTISGSGITLTKPDGTKVETTIVGKDKTTKFEGTWKNSAGSQNTYKFTNNKWERTNNNNQNANGTFTFTNEKITFTPSSGSSWTQDYTLEETTLTLTSDGSHVYGTFKKDNGGGTPNTEPKTIVIEGIPDEFNNLNIIGTVFSDLDNIVNHLPVNAGIGNATISGGVLSVELFVPQNNMSTTQTKWTGNGSYYIYFAPNNNGFNTPNGMIYVGTGSTPLKYNINQSVITLQNGVFKNYNVYK